MKTSFKIYKNRPNSTKTAILILHGGGPEGVETKFISNIFSSLSDTKKHDIFALNMPYCERKDEISSGPDLAEEILTLEEFFESELSNYNSVIIVAKSLGGLIANYWLAKNPKESIQKLFILGLLVNEYNLSAFKDKHIIVFQGELDKFGSNKDVEEYLTNAEINCRVVSIQGADHSYRNQFKEPVFQQEVIEMLSNEIFDNK